MDTASPSRPLFARAVRLAAGAVCLGLVLPLALPPPVEQDERRSVRVVDREGRLLREVRPYGSSLPVRLAEVPDFAVAALVATEDHRFYRHPGIDPVALLRAARQNAQAGRVVSGGSTLPMQLARMLRAADGVRARGLREKLAEAHLAVRLDLWMSKDEILEAWLARAPFGRQTRGLAAAAALYFGKAPGALTDAEAALLIGLPQSPSRLDPYRAPDRARARQRRVLAAMAERGQISHQEARRLGALPLDFRPPGGRFLAPHYVERLLAEGSVGEIAGAKLATSLDLPLQRTAERLAASHVGRLGRERVGQTAALVLDNASGDVLAYVGSADFFDAEAQGQTDGVRALRQPGSALKPFTYAAAIEALGYGPATVLPDRPDAVSESGGAFVPANYDGRFHGDVPLRRALAASYNVPAVVAAERVGLGALLAFYRASGLRSLTQPADHYGAAMTLGAGEVTLFELAQAYAMLGRCASGLACTAPGGTGAPFSPTTAALIADVLADPAARESAFGRGSALELPFPVAVKTGTSKDYRDTWAVGFSPTHTVAVWAGNFSGAPMREVSGVSGAAPLLAALFEEIGTGGAFPFLSGVDVREVCPTSGHAPGAFCPSAHVELFSADAPALPTCAQHRPPAVSAGTGPVGTAGAPLTPVVHPGPDILRITAPAAGSVFALDPVLRAGFQRLPIRYHAPPGVSAVAVYVDDVRVESGGGGASWPLRPGRHVVEVRARDAAGRSVAGAPVSFRVRGVAQTPSPLPRRP